MEIHCSIEQQKKMAEIFKETLQSELLLEPLDGVEEGRLPSPEELKYKILLKVHALYFLINFRLKTAPRTLTIQSQILPAILLSPERTQKR